MATFQYKRVLLKMSGESLCQPGGFGLDSDAMESVAQRITAITKSGLQVAIVLGGGNFLRGQAFSQQGKFRRSTADSMGMLATVINACALQETLQQQGQPARVLSAVAMPSVCESFVERLAIEHLDAGRVVILAGGTGNPFFSTDSGAALRSAQLQVDLMIKATKVDGVYTDDPMTNPNAVLIEKMTYQDVLTQNLKVMDATAVSLCRESHVPIVVLNIFKDGNITRALRGEHVGTLISE